MRGESEADVRNVDARDVHVSAWGRSDEQAALTARLGDISPRHWLLLDAAIRRDHRTERPAMPQVRENETVVQLGVRSMDRDGFVREQAVRVLGARDDALVGAFLGLRTFDWVDEVSSVAREALASAANGCGNGAVLWTGSKSTSK